MVEHLKLAIAPPHFFFIIIFWLVLPKLMTKEIMCVETLMDAIGVVYMSSETVWIVRGQILIELLDKMSGSTTKL